MDTWVIVAIAAVLILIVFMYMRSRKKHAMVSAVATAKKPASKKSRWRRAIGGVASVSKLPGVSMIPGAGAITTGLQGAGALGLT